jgi:hypothetical protein
MSTMLFSSVPHFHEHGMNYFLCKLCKNSSSLAAFVENSEGNSVWYLCNNDNAHCALAIFLQSYLPDGSLESENEQCPMNPLLPSRGCNKN